MGSIDQIKGPIILFDGVCNLCNASVQFILKRDKKNQFQFSSLQSAFAKENFPDHTAQENDLQSLVLIKEGQLFTKSTAALNIARSLSGAWPLLYGFIVIPKFLRDAIYTMIARNRYKWFGRKNECMIPSKELKSRFIES